MEEISPNGKGKAAEGLAWQVEQYLDAHYHGRVTLDDISRAVHASKYYLAHAFKQETGISPMHYVIKRRVGEAQTLLATTDISVTEISERLGYGNTCYFSTVFTKYVGVSPGRYRVFVQTGAFSGKMS